MIAIIDYGMGNLLSVRNAFEYLGKDNQVASDPAVLAAAERVVLPGVGAFPDAMANLEAGGWIEALQREVIMNRKPFLGICLGMQLLAEAGEETRPCRGLGWVKGAVRRLEAAGHNLKVPQVGWNEISLTRETPLFRGISDGVCFYFVHSYHLIAQEPADVAAKCDYGHPVVAAIQKGNIFATQFHPEKSQENGLRVLENFADWQPMKEFLPC